jgi:hypothetical protein
MSEDQNRSNEALAEITAIVRERYETGAYGDCHFRVGAEVLRLMREVPASPQREVLSGGLGSLLAIPIVPDDSLPDDGWQLVQWTYDREPPFTRHDAVIKEGVTR